MLDARIVRRRKKDMVTKEGPTRGFKEYVPGSWNGGYPNSLFRLKKINKSHLQPMDLIITILPVVTKDLPISPRFTPYDFLSRYKFSNLTTRQPIVGFYLLTFQRFPLRKERTQILTLVIIELTTSALRAGVQVTY